jgi:enoyl-CoA hydratase/carnithine racemase
MSYKGFTVEKENGTAVVAINVPPANTYNFELMKELDAIIEDIRLDTDVNVMILTGSDKMFSAGADINMLKKSDPAYKATFCLHCQETLMELERIPKIVIAAINGHCVGGGLEIAMACDLRFMRSGGQIGLPEVTLGVLPGTGGTQRLPRLVGKGRAIDLMITGRTISPEEAKDIGLINDVCEGDAVEFAQQYAAKLNAGATRAIGLIKVAVQEGTEMALSNGLALERELQNRLFVTDDAKEGLAAFLEKRKPAFKGR